MNRSTAQPDLFGDVGLAGLSQSDAFVTPGEEQRLIASIDAAQLSPFRFHGWLGKRLTASYGWRYDFDDASFAPAEAIPDWLLPLRAKAARFASLEPGELVQALLIRYDPGAGIGWHRDRPVFVSSAYRSEPRRRCGSGDASPAVSIGRRGSWRRGRFTT
jgi:alkylated DNA repair protein (DNA oxidative demethylase)